MNRALLAREQRGENAKYKEQWGESIEVWEYMHAIIRNGEQSCGARNVARQWG